MCMSLSCQLESRIGSTLGGEFVQSFNPICIFDSQTVNLLSSSTHSISLSDCFYVSVVRGSCNVVVCARQSQPWSWILYVSMCLSACDTSGKKLPRHTDTHTIHTTTCTHFGPEHSNGLVLV